MTDSVASPIRFELLSADSGIDFTYYGGPSDRAYMTEVNGGGVALDDFNNDGRLDVFLVNGSNFDQPARGPSQSNQLYQATADLQFRNVTEAARLLAHGFGMGCASDDYDNDGFSDLFVACFGRDRMWRNNGDGTFTEVTDVVGLEEELWGSSASFADLDGDGLSDLYVVNYVDWSPEEPPCHTPGIPGKFAVCSPIDRPGQPDALYRNSGEGGFVEIGAEAGVASVADGKGLALSISDLDHDGRLDIYIANDQTRNFLYRNLGEMNFEEVAVLQGVAFSGNGVPGASMGIALATMTATGVLICV